MNSRIGFTNEATLHNNQSDGFTIGLIHNSQNALLNQQEIAPMYFNTSMNPRMQIHENGFVGIGNYNAFDPNYQLQLFLKSVENYMQITSFGTGFAANDGVLLGTNSDDEAILFQQEDERMLFRTSNIPRMQIANNDNFGFVGIGNYDGFLPQHLLHIHGGDEPTGFQITKGGTGFPVLTSDGFLITVSNNGTTFDANIFNQEEEGEISFLGKNAGGTPFQIARMYSSVGFEGNVGFGTIYTTGSQATENVDIQFNARIRTMPDAPIPNAFDNVLIDVDGVLHRGDASVPGGADHDWYNQVTLNNVTASEYDDIYTFGNVFMAQCQK